MSLNHFVVLESKEVLRNEQKEKEKKTMMGHIKGTQSSQGQSWNNLSNKINQSILGDIPSIK